MRRRQQSGRGYLRCRLFLFFSLVLFAWLILPSAVTAGLLEDALSPLAGLDIPSFYTRYSGVVDAIIYLIIFAGLTQLTLGKRLGTSRAAKAVAAGVGMTLALALVIMQRAMDFSIAQFGPYAAAVVVILATSVLFYLLRTLGAGGIASFSASYVIVYFLLRAVVPNFFSYLQASAPGLHGLIAAGALICLIAALWRLGAGLWPGGSDGIRASIEPVAERPATADKAAACLAEEKRLLKWQLGSVQKQRVKDSEAIIADLASILATIDQYGDTTESRRMIAEKLSAHIIPRVRKLRTSLRALRKLYARVERFELAMLLELKHLPPAQRKAAKNEIRAKLKKLNVEERIKGVTAKMEDNERLFRTKLTQAARQINAGRMDLGKESIGQARKTEDHMRELGEEIDELATLLRGLTSREMAGGVAV